MIYPPITTARLRRVEFIRDHGIEPTKITMHPRVWMDLVETLSDGGYLDFMRDPCEVYLMDMLVVKDATWPGIEMTVS